MMYVSLLLQVCGVKMSDSELLDVMQEARADDGSVSTDTLTRLLVARANALRASAAAAPAAKDHRKRYTSVPAVDHTEMRQEWVPYGPGGGAGAARGLPTLESDDVFYSGEPHRARRLRTGQLLQLRSPLHASSCDSGGLGSVC